MRERVVLALVVLVVLAAGKPVGRPSGPSVRAIARVDKVEISYSDFEARVKATRGLPDDPDSLLARKRSMLDEMIFDQVLVLEAATLDLNADSTWPDRRRRALEQFVLSLMYQDEIVATTQVDDRAIERFYDSNLDRFTLPERVRARHVLVKYDRAMEATDSSGALLASARKKIADARAAVAAGEDFAEVAKRFSDDPASARNGGDLGLFGRGRMVKEFEDVAFALPVGQVSDTVRTTFGYHVIKVEEHLGAEVQPLTDSLREALRQNVPRELQRQKADAFVDSLRRAARVAWTDEAASMTDSALAAAPWPDTTVVARVDDVPVRLSQFKAEYMRVARLPAPPDSLADRRRDMATSIAVTDLLVAAAHGRGYFDRPEAVQRAADIERDERVRRMRTSKPVGAAPTPEEVRAYYERNADRYVEKRPLNVQHIVFMPEDSARCWAVWDSARSGSDFRALALAHYPGDPDIREVLFNLGWIGPGEMPQSFYDAANALAVDSVSAPVRTEYGWHIIKLEGRKQQPTFESIESRVRGDVLKLRNSEAEERWRRELLSRHRVWIDERLLAQPVLGS